MAPPVRRTRFVALLAGLFLIAAIAVPVLGQAGRPGAAPDNLVAAASEKPGKGPKAEKVPETPVSLTGRVGTRTDADGDTVYTLTVGTTVYDLQVGPPWWWGDAHPLKDLVGDTVKIEGDQPQGANEIDVRSIDGTVVREAGRPPWAGGWKTVGEKHPGWSQDKADRQAEKAKAKAERGTGRPSWAGPKPSPEPGN